MISKRHGRMRLGLKPRGRPTIEVCLVPSVEGLPPGDMHPYRDMDPQEREALFLATLIRIRRETGMSGTPPESTRIPLDEGGRRDLDVRMSGACGENVR